VLIEVFSLYVTAESLREKRDQKSAISLQLTRPVCSEISGTRGQSPQIIFARIVRPINTLQLCRW